MGATLKSEAIRHACADLHLEREPFQRAVDTQSMKPMEQLNDTNQARPPRSEPAPSSQRVLPLDGVRERLGEEVARADRYGRPLSVLELSLEGLDPAHQGAVSTLLTQHVRALDRLGWNGDHRIVVVCPETSGEGATALGQRLVGALAAVAPGVRGAVACHPSDGGDGETLLARTTLALRTTEQGQVTASTGAGTMRPRAFRPIDDEVRELERTRMRQALEASGGNQTRAAMLIAMPLRTFVSKLKLYGLPTGGRKRKSDGPPSAPTAS